MTKQCPNCGTEIDKQVEVCPECGYSFEKEQIKEETVPNEKTDSNEKSDDTSNFLNKEQNENIEWSELKDMSIGHVMTMFNEQQPEEKTTDPIEEIKKEKSETKAASIEEKAAELEEPVSAEAKTDEIVDTAALDQYINEHKNETPTIETPSEIERTEETDETAEINEQPTTAGTSSESKDKGQDDVKSNEPDHKPSEPTNKETEQAKEVVLKEEITKFTKPEDQTIDSKPIGPKALPNTATEIPSKSKKPEEIEMDAAPIFFKDGEEVKSAKDQFEKLTGEQNLLKEVKGEESTTSASKNYKKISIVLAAVIVLSGGSWFAYSQTQKKSASDGEVTQKQDKVATQTEKELNSYFTDDKQLFLKPEMVSVSPKAIKENLDTLKSEANYKELETLYKKVVDKQAAVTKVNELFAQPIINGNKLNDVAIKADKKVDLAKREEKDDFDKLLNQATEQATSQYDQLQKAKTAVAVFYENNELTETLSRENYTAAKTEVDKVKSETLRKPLTEALTKADKSLTDAETAVAVQQQAQADQTAAQTSETPANNQGSTSQAANDVQPDSSTFSAPNADGVYTDPVYSVNPTDVSDMSNPAWSWAPGVQEKVIATCIERGYIKAGEYSLQPARIINGEGYYNLYGSDNQYLVTINAKTGWFKGNASRNAGR